MGNGAGLFPHGSFGESDLKGKEMYFIFSFNFSAYRFNYGTRGREISYFGTVAWKHKKDLGGSIRKLWGEEIL